ncbi:MAG: hypothetical protein U1D55_14060 [Phycisphaerae bacterium]
MIALIILGLGLLFIAAALPVGLSYTRETIDRATAESAGEYALDMISTQVRTSRQRLVTPDPVYGGSVQNSQIRRDNVVRPRATNAIGTVQPGDLLPESDPLLATGGGPAIKVRPLIAENLKFAPLGSVSDNGEELAGVWLGAIGLPTTLDQADYPAANVLSAASNPTLASLSRVYPPVSPQRPFLVADFGSNNNYPAYGPRFTPTIGQPGITSVEENKAVDSRTSWTAFYRRVAYGSNSDPLLYEIIVVVCGRPSGQHRFAQQDPTGGFAQPVEFSNNQVNLVAPVPWLLTFVGLPQPPNSAFVLNGANREIPGGSDLPMYFTLAASNAMGSPDRLLPVGSIFLPAVNDGRTIGVNGFNSTVPGFTPHSPTALPIYEVTARPDATTVVVKNNGFYPFIPAGGSSANWPVWVIPPTFTQRSSVGQPIFEKRTSVLAVSRRFVRLREIP